MEKGIIKMIDPIKGFGFIVTEDEDEVYFNLKDVHPKYRNKPLREGDMVGFDLRREMKGDRAINIRHML
ncbi:MAG: cold shock domain-containing protein [Calditrichaeota bacterium]|nr:MAG: cold shock domain-containing protein [Calditrichota bacterium]